MAQLALAAAGAPQAPDGPATQRFLDLALNARDEQALRAFDLSEEAFVALDAQERTATLERYSRISAGLRRLARAGVQRARAAAAAGGAETARRLLDAIERVGAANDRRDVVKIGQLTAQAVLRLVQQARRELFSPADDRASEPPAG